MGNKWLWISAGTLLVVGLTLLALGVALPIVIEEQVNAGIDDSWMHKDDFDSWGETPGKYDLKVVREYSIFNVTNPNEILLGDKPRVVEVGPFPFQEYSQFLYWKYLDEDFNDLGNEVQLGRQKASISATTTSSTWCTSPIMSLISASIRQSLPSMHLPIWPF